MGPGFARPRAPEPFGGFSKKKLAAAFHPRVLFNRTTGYSRPHKEFFCISCYDSAHFLEVTSKGLCTIREDSTFTHALVAILVFVH